MHLEVGEFHNWAHVLPYDVYSDLACRQVICMSEVGTRWIRTTTGRSPQGLPLVALLRSSACSTRPLVQTINDIRTSMGEYYKTNGRQSKQKQESIACAITQSGEKDR